MTDEMMFHANMPHMRAFAAQVITRLEHAVSEIEALDIDPGSKLVQVARLRRLIAQIRADQTRTGSGWTGDGTT